MEVKPRKSLNPATPPEATSLCPSGDASCASVCNAKATGCTPLNCNANETACSGACKDLLTDNASCGACDNACTGGRSCVNGVCRCPGEQLFCGEQCVDVKSDPNHCGGCAGVCSAGRACTNGACECDPGLSFCDGACVDLQTQNEHCGSCGNACDGGRSCRAGSCECPEGLTFCGGNCVDVASNGLHCGACDKPCGDGKSCVSGFCSGAGGLGADGCMGLAGQLTLKQFAAYQSVKIPIMQDGMAIDVGSRNADLVAGRQTLFRAFVELDPGFVGRELSMRLTIDDGATSERYYQRKVISGNSVDEAPETTFQVTVPKEKIAAGSRYYLELVECTASAAAQVKAPAFPPDESLADLGVRTTGPLKIRIIPIQANGKLPSTAAGALNNYVSQLEAMYPVSSVQVELGEMITTAYPLDWTAVLDQVRAKRQADRPPADVYYYGLVKPEDTFRAFCGSACTTGIAYVSMNNNAGTRAAVGIGFADAASAVTMAHEIGHSHGRGHAPCVSNGSIANVDESYPYAGAEIGVWGYDSRAEAIFAPDSRTDMMGYCSSKWLSDYTYQGILNRAAIVNGAAQDFFLGPEALSSWRVLLLDARGPRWGIPVKEPAPPSGVPSYAELIGQDGQVLGPVEVFVTEISELDAWSVQIREGDVRGVGVRLPGFPLALF